MAKSHEVTWADLNKEQQELLREGGCLNSNPIQALRNYESMLRFVEDFERSEVRKEVEIAEKNFKQAFTEYEKSKGELKKLGIDNAREIYHNLSRAPYPDSHSKQSSDPTERAFKNLLTQGKNFEKYTRERNETHTKQTDVVLRTFITSEINRLRDIVDATKTVTLITGQHITPHPRKQILRSAEKKSDKTELVNAFELAKTILMQSPVDEKKAHDALKKWAECAMKYQAGKTRAEEKDDYRIIALHPIQILYKSLTSASERKAALSLAAINELEGVIGAMQDKHVDQKQLADYKKARESTVFTQFQTLFTQMKTSTLMPDSSVTTQARRKSSP